MWEHLRSLAATGLFATATTWDRNPSGGGSLGAALANVRCLEYHPLNRWKALSWVEVNKYSIVFCNNFCACYSCISVIPILTISPTVGGYEQHDVCYSTTTLDHEYRARSAYLCYTIYTLYILYQIGSVSHIRFISHQLDLFTKLRNWINCPRGA